MKRFICLMLVLASLFLVSCGGTVTPTETEEPVATTEQTATEATTAKEEVTEPVIDAVLPTDFDDVYWCERFNGELMNALDEAKPGDVFKDDFVFGDGKDRIAIYVEFADFDDQTGKNYESDKIEIFKYFNSIGIETYFWNGVPYIIVDREQAEKLGAIAGHDSFAVVYIQAMSFKHVAAMNASEKEKAYKIYETSETCDFYIQLGQGLSIDLEIKKIETKDGRSLTPDERDEIKTKFVDAYISKITDYVGIDASKMNYRVSVSGTLEASVTLTKEELETILKSDYYVANIFVDEHWTPIPS